MAALPPGHINTSENLTPIEGEALLRIDAELELHKMEAKELRTQFIALLPIATADQFAAVKVSARDESELPEGCRVNQDFKLSTEQLQILKEIRAERTKHLTANKEAYITPLLSDVTQRLTSLKVRVGTKKTITTARFERTNVTTAPKVGLMAALRASQLSE